MASNFDITQFKPIQKQHAKMLKCIKFVLKERVDLIESGDCGSWDVDDDPQVKKMRRIIAEVEGN